MSKAEQVTLLKPASPELLARIRKELNEDESTRERDVGLVRAWLAQQPHLPRIDDNFILAFLRGCKFSLEKTKRKIDMYFTIRGAVPEMFTRRDIERPEIKLHLKRHSFFMLPDLTPEGYVVLCHHTQLVDGFTYTLLELLRVLSMVVDISLCEQREPVAGTVVIMNSVSLKPAIAVQYTPVVLKQLVTYAEEALPLRLRQLHVTNASPLTYTLYNFIKQFLPEKLHKRVFVHPPKSDGLFEHVPRKILPQEMGGTAGSARAVDETWRQKMRQYKDWFRQQEAVKSDESLRPGKPRNYDEMFGVEGSFRKLDLD